MFNIITLFWCTRNSACLNVKVDGLTRPHECFPRQVSKYEMKLLSAVVCFATLVLSRHHADTSRRPLNDNAAENVGGGNPGFRKIEDRRAKAEERKAKRAQRKEEREKSMKELLKIGQATNRETLTEQERAIFERSAERECDEDDEQCIDARQLARHEVEVDEKLLALKKTRVNYHSLCVLS